MAQSQCESHQTFTVNIVANTQMTITTSLCHTPICNNDHMYKLANGGAGVSPPTLVSNVYIFVMYSIIILLTFADARVYGMGAG